MPVLICQAVVCRIVLLTHAVVSARVTANTLRMPVVNKVGYRLLSDVVSFHPAGSVVTNVIERTSRLRLGLSLGTLAASLFLATTTTTSSSRLLFVTNGQLDRIGIWSDCVGDWSLELQNVLCSWTDN